MKKINIIIGIIISLVVFIIIFLITFVIIVVSNWKNTNLRAKTEIPLTLEKISSVEKVKVLTNEGDFGMVELVIDIFLKDGGILSVSKVDENGAGLIRIHRIGNYEILVMDSYGSARILTLDLLKQITDLSLNTIYDLTKNYDLIYAYIKDLPNISEYREYPYESRNAITDRMLAEYREECAIISVDNKKYFLALYNYGDFVNYPPKEKF
jgi:hypothetical protein